MSVCLDGGPADIHTGIGFFDHMLEAFALHAGYGLTVQVKGDLHVDGHHTVEDTGIVLGDALAQALGKKSGIARYGSFWLPMDEALAFCAVDISGRPFLVFDAAFPEERIGEYDSCLTKEFFRALAFHARDYSAFEGGLRGKFPPHGRGAVQGGRSCVGSGYTALRKGGQRLFHQGLIITGWEDAHDHFTGY